MRRHTVVLTLLGLVAIASGTKPFELHGNMKNLPSRREVKKGHFGALEISEFYEDNDSLIMEKTVFPSKKDFARDYER